MTKFDFEDRLLDFLNTLDVGFPVYADANDTDSSVSIVRLPGSRTISEDFDGNKDKLYKFFVQIKAEVTERVKATGALQVISEALDDDELEILSNNDSYDYLQTTVSNEPYYMGQGPDSFLYFRFSFDTELTIYNKQEEN